MEKIVIDSHITKDENGRPVLRLVVHGREVTAVFAEEHNNVICPRLKQALIDSYLRNCGSGKTA